MDMIDPTRFVLAFLFVIGLIGLMAWVLKHYGAPKLLMRNEPGGRIQVVETRWLDTRRRLLLVKRDDVEHLILIADGRETVIETGIKNDKKDV